MSTVLETPINPELIKKIQKHFFITNIERKIHNIDIKIKNETKIIKVYENLNKINKLLDRLIQDPTNTTLKSELICLINKFDWDKFINSEKLRISKYNRIDKKLMLSLQQLQTGDIIGFSDIPDSCITSLDLSRSRDLPRSNTFNRKRKRSNSGISKTTSNKFTKKNKNKK